MSYKFNLFTYFICHEKYLAEFFGTLFLVLLACGSAVLAGAAAGAALLYRFWSLGLANGFNFGGITDISGNYLATNVCQPGVSQGMALLCEKAHSYTKKRDRGLIAPVSLTYIKLIYFT